MAYDPTKLRLIDDDFSGNVARLWFYTTVADADATIVGAGYFSDGVKRGMKVGDMVKAVATTGPKSKEYQVSALTTTAATVTAVTAIT